MPRRLPKAILQRSLALTMKFTALQSFLWNDDDFDCNEDDAEFLEDLYACWSALKVNDVWLRVSKALLDVILGLRYSTTSLTEFQTPGSGLF